MNKITFLCFFAIQILYAQEYTEYLTGNVVDMTTNHQSGICMMGGSSEQDDAMAWFLTQADGGDVVVLRASGDDGYNNYFYSSLGISINSVRTFVIHSEAGAIDPYVLEKVANAEAIWFAGGDQFDYVSYFKDNAMEEALNAFINVKKGVIGGTSAGMAILGSFYFTAQYGSLDSAVALSNPYHPRVALGYNDFLEIPFLEDVITDSHFADREREGRLSVFIARYVKDQNKRSFGIACNEYTAICVDAEGKASVYGNHPAYPEYAYFLQSNCVTDFAPENASQFTPLTWNKGGEAIKVYIVPGTSSGTNNFDLSTWNTGSGGTWENWAVDNGNLLRVASSNPMCDRLFISDHPDMTVAVFPNPVADKIFIKSRTPVHQVKLYNILGKEVAVSFSNGEEMNVSSLQAGLYILKLTSNTSEQSFRIIKN